MSGRNGQVLLSTWVPAAIADAFKGLARQDEGGTSAALRRLVSKTVSNSASVLPVGIGRGAQIGVRLKSSERQALDEAARARATSPANWLRSLALVHLARKPEWNGAELAELRETFKELRRIGNNVNQIAKAMNHAAHSGYYPPHQAQAVEEASREIRQEMRRVVAVMTGNFDYWGLPSDERPGALTTASEAHTAEVKAAEKRRKVRPRKRPAKFAGSE